jgi:hypothetical protein
MKFLVAAATVLLALPGCLDDRANVDDPAIADDPAALQGGPVSFKGPYLWTGANWGTGMETFMLGNACLAVPAAGFPNPAPLPPMVCTAKNCVPDPAFPGCFTCALLVCGAGNLPPAPAPSPIESL